MTGADSSRKGHFHLVVSGAAFKGWPGRWVTDAMAVGVAGVCRAEMNVPSPEQVPALIAKAARPRREHRRWRR